MTDPADMTPAELRAEVERLRAQLDDALFLIALWVVCLYKPSKPTKL